MLGRTSQRKAVQRFNGVVAGAKLILPRRWLRANTSFAVPAGAGWIIVRAVGPGGASENDTGRPGGGGAFAREDRACSPGQTVDVVVLVGATGSTAAPTSVSLAGTVICQAASGQAATNGVSGLGGKDTDSIGTIRYSGGDGAPGGGVAPSSGTNGAPGGAGTNAAGGGSAGETNASDVLILGGAGSDGTSADFPSRGTGKFPGGGGSVYYNSTGNLVAAPGGGGLAVVEFWSAKP